MTEDDDGAAVNEDEQSTALSPPLSTSALPPTPPLPSSPTIDLEMEVELDSEDEGPPPGWDNSYQLNEQAELLSTPADASGISSDIKTEDVQQDVQNEDVPQPRTKAHSSPAPEPVQSDLKMEEQGSEDEGPPPGWDNKDRLNEQAGDTPAVILEISSDIKTEDIQQDAQNEAFPQPPSKAYSSPAPEQMPSDLNMEEQGSEDEGPPPGWDNKDQLNEQAEQLVTPAVISEISSDLNLEEQDSEDEGPPPGWDNKDQLKEQTENISSDIKMEDLRQDAQNEEGQPLSLSQAQELVSSDIKTDQQDSEDEGPPPGWDSKCHTEPELQTACSTTPLSDRKTEVVQEDARNDDGPEPQSQPRASPAPEQDPSEKQDSEDEGPPPGWDSKCMPEHKLQTSHPTTPQSEIKTTDVQQDDQNEDNFQSQSQSHPSPAPEPISSDMKEDQQDSEDDGPPPGWDSKCQPEPRPQPEPEPEPKLLLARSTASPSAQKDAKVVEEIPQQPTRQQSLPPIRRQISVPKPPTSINHPEMGQMVCGSCRHLLSYPRGSRYVECACCLEENYVLEEHEVGQVICGGCNVLLMYPYGAPKVRCANCSMETEIGDQNRRPPLSEQQSRARRHLKRVHVG